jgi:demethylmenaquinone methyltransferase/2-methoxy-6-polyprenyl-1,4-benzoquinol methylase
MLLSNRDIFIKNIFSSVAVHIDFLSSFFSFGLDNAWRRKLVQLSGVKDGTTVLDVCTGTGKLAFLLSRQAGANGAVIGADFCEDMLRIAVGKLNPQTANISFIISDAKNLCVPDESFDMVTTAFGMRNIHDTMFALSEVQRVLKPGGRFFCLELTTPNISWFLPIYKVYVFKVIPLIGKMITKTTVPYNYLPRSIEAFFSPNEFRKIMEQTGFCEVTVHPMTLGIATIYEARKTA